MVDVDPLKSDCQPLLNRLNQHALPFADQVGRFGSRCKQTIGKRDNFVRRGHQAQQRPRARDHMELAPAPFGQVLQRQDVGGDRRRQANDPLAVQGMCDAQLLTRHAQPANPQKCTR